MFQVVCVLGLRWDGLEGPIHCGPLDSLETHHLLLQMSNYSFAVLKENALVTQVSVLYFLALMTFLVLYFGHSVS